MKPFVFFLLAAALCVATAACRKRAARTDASSAPLPAETTAAVNPTGKDVAAPSVYDAGNAQSRDAAGKDRRFMKMALAFRDGSPAQRKVAREELQRLPPAERAEFETLCKNMKIPVD